jgi:mono/diheme cytochrome c family protein
MHFLKPIIGVLVAYLLLKIGVPFLGSLSHPGTWPVVPTSVLKMYMFFVIAGAFLMSTFDEEGYKGLVGPIVDLYSNPAKAKACMGVIVAIGVFGAYVGYQYVKPTFDAPVELRSIHPAPPASATMWGKAYDLQSLKNPFRDDKANFAKNVEEGGVVYYQNCFYCHGDKLDGKGHFASAFSPLPANFTDVGTIAQLTESFVFWRVGTGGPGLPSEGTPWISAMPVWHNHLTEEQLWKVVMFIYDYSGYQPRVTAAVAK